MLWRTIRSMEVMAHSSNFLLPKLHQPAKTPANNYTLVVLNQQLPRFMPRLWAQAKMRICADGGANRVFDEMSQMKNDLDRNRDPKFLINHITKRQQICTSVFPVSAIAHLIMKSLIFVFLLLEHLVEGLIMRLQISMCSMCSQTCGLSFCQMIA